MLGGGPSGTGGGASRNSDEGRQIVYVILGEREPLFAGSGAREEATLGSLKGISRGGREKRENDRLDDLAHAPQKQNMVELLQKKTRDEASPTFIGGTKRSREKKGHGDIHLKAQCDARTKS